MIAVVGDVMLDILMDGNLKGVAPGEPMSQWMDGKLTTRLGGAGFVASALKKMGVNEVHLFGCIGLRRENGGADMFGREVSELCLDEGIINAFYASGSTSAKLYTINNGHQVMRFDNNKDKVNYDARVYLSYMSSADAIIVVDMSEGFVAHKSFDLSHVTCPIFIDPRPENMDHYPQGEHVTMVCNERSALKCARASNVLGHEGVPQQLATLEAHSGGRAVITQGAAGAAWMEPSGTVRTTTSESAHVDEIASTVGAGNVFIARLAMEILDDMPFSVAVPSAEYTARQFVHAEEIYP